MMQQSDIQLVDLALNGDLSGYKALVDRYKDLAFTIAFRILRVREDAEEVVQDAFVKVYRNLGQFEKRAKFSTWLYRIVYNTAISKKRIKAPASASLDENTVLISAATEDQQDLVEETEERERLVELALKTLPDDEKTIVILYYMEESSVEDIHKVTGLSKANVKIKLFRTRKKLQAYIKNFSKRVCVEPNYAGI
jgi:RNA polymerase sigma-70 factor (ECF subfamily)